MKNKAIRLFDHTFKNPVIPSSGTFGFGYEFAEYYDINVLGSIALKGSTIKERYGNPLPRIAECHSGLINAIGLQNPGVDKVIEEEIPLLDKVYQDKVIMNIGGHSTSDYVEACKKFNDIDKVVAIELNISCPNVKGGGLAFGTDPEVAYNLIKEVRKAVTKPLIVKLSPNVTDITEMALAAERAGADAISLINCLQGMRFDLRTAKPIISVKKGGYSGRAVLPVALKMVYDCYEKINIPIIGIGGISTAYDVIEMMYAGASLVMVGSENLINPYACRDIINDLERVMEELGINDLNDIIGLAHKN